MAEQSAAESASPSDLHNPQPRARLLTAGPQALTDVELLSIVLRRRRQSSADQHRLQESDGLSGLFSLDIQNLQRLGFSRPQAVTLAAVGELTRRQARQRVGERFMTRKPAEVARYLYLRFAEGDQEVMGALFVDMSNRLIGEAEVFRGSLTRATVEPRPLIRRALVLKAAGLILFHTHPGGDPEPSPEDLSFTDRLAESCALLGIRLLDHLILGREGTFVSLKRRGRLS